MLHQDEPAFLLPGLQPAIGSILDTPSDASHRRLTVGVALALNVLCVASLPFSTRPGLVIPPFLSMILSIMMISEFITAFLFFDQFLLNRKIPLLVLASTYLYSGAIIIPHVLTFPGVFSNNGWLGASPESSTWLWVFWHGGFPIGLILYGLSTRSDRFMSRLSAHPLLSTGIAVLTVLLLVVMLTILTTHFSSFLPVIIEKGNYHKILTTGVGPAVWILNLGCVATLADQPKKATLVRLGVSIASIASFIDVSLTLYAGSRYMVGWYIARFNSLCAGIVVLLFLLAEIVRLYQTLFLQQERISYLAYHDALTGLGNRRLFAEKLGGWLKQPETGQLASILMIDLDGFKSVNDKYGHEAGDELLVEIAARLKRCVGESDVVIRLGGDEFVLLIISASEVSAVEDLANQIIESLQQPVCVEDGKLVTVTASLGVVPFYAGEKSQSILIRRADEALYKAKHLGKNRYVLAV